MPRSSVSWKFTVAATLHPIHCILPSARIWSLADRDDKSAEEVAEMETRMVITLPQRNLESFLFSDDVIEALVVNQDKQDVLQPALDVKKQAIEKSVARGHPTDDLKSASGEIYIGLKRLLDLQRCGNTADAFMRDTLAQLVEPSMQTFQSLKTSIIDKVTH